MSEMQGAMQVFSESVPPAQELRAVRAAPGRVALLEEEMRMLSAASKSQAMYAIFKVNPQDLH